MNAIGSSGSVWSDSSVNKMLSTPFGEGSTVTLSLDAHCRELRVQVTRSSCDGHQLAMPQEVAVRRLVRRGITLPPLHVIAHLTDCAFPAFGEPARAVVEVLHGQR